MGQGDITYHWKTNPLNTNCYCKQKTKKANIASYSRYSKSQWPKFLFSVYIDSSDGLSYDFPLFEDFHINYK